jgi:hypothetical protein
MTPQSLFAPAQGGDHREDTSRSRSLMRHKQNLHHRLCTFGNLGSSRRRWLSLRIVFGVPEDPDKLGLAASLARPGGNSTGINFFLAEVTAKRLELLRALVPAATRVAVLVNGP